MSYLFDDASSQYLSAPSAVASGVPLTIASFIRSNDDNAAQTVVCIGSNDQASTNEFRLALAGTSAGDPVRAVSTAAGTSVFADSAAGYTANTWHHVAGVFASTTSRTAYIDGGSAGSNATSSTPASLNETVIGALRNDSADVYANYMSGEIAELGIWTAALNAAEIAWLARGASPLSLTHRLGSLVFYRDLIRNINGGWSRGPTLTNNNGATVAAHAPKVIPYSFRRRMVVPGAAAAANIFRHTLLGSRRGSRQAA